MTTTLSHVNNESARQWRAQQRSQREFQDIIISERQWSPSSLSFSDDYVLKLTLSDRHTVELCVDQKLLWVFRESCSYIYCERQVGGWERSSNGGRREDKSACISTTKVSSAPKSYVWSVHGSDHDHHGCQNRCRAFVNTHGTPGSRCISPAGQSHPSEWYSSSTFTPSRLWLHPPARTYSSKVSSDRLS